MRRVISTGSSRRSRCARLLSTSRTWMTTTGSFGGVAVGVAATKGETVNLSGHRRPRRRRQKAVVTEADAPARGRASRANDAPPHLPCAVCGGARRPRRRRRRRPRRRQLERTIFRSDHASNYLPLKVSDVVQPLAMACGSQGDWVRFAAQRHVGPRIERRDSERATPDRASDGDCLAGRSRGGSGATSRGCSPR